VTDSSEVSALISAVAGGEPDALERLLPMVYQHLRRLAHRELRRERADHTLSTTALVHEAYLKLAQSDRLTWKDRAHFFAICAQAMRRVLVNYAVARKTAKRGGGALHLPIEDVAVAAHSRPDDVVWVDQALARLEALSPRQTRVVECRVFGGMGVRETAEALEISPATVKRDWALARAWLRREMDAA